MSQYFWFLFSLVCTGSSHLQSPLVSRPRTLASQAPHARYLLGFCLLLAPPLAICLICDLRSNLLNLNISSVGIQRWAVLLSLPWNMTGGGVYALRIGSFKVGINQTVSELKDLLEKRPAQDRMHCCHLCAGVLVSLQCVSLETALSDSNDPTLISET